MTKIQDGVQLKNDDNKIRIAGAVLRIEVKPRSYTGSDYKLTVWLPNHKQFECSDIGSSYVQWSEFMAALVEAATGHRPRDGTERKVVDIYGFPTKVKETEDKKTTTILVSIDPLLEDYKIVTKPVVVTGLGPSTTPALPNKTTEETKHNPQDWLGNQLREMNKEETDAERLQRLNNEMGCF